VEVDFGRGAGIQGLPGNLVNVLELSRGGNDQTVDFAIGRVHCLATKIRFISDSSGLLISSAIAVTAFRAGACQRRLDRYPAEEATKMVCRKGGPTVFKSCTALLAFGASSLFAQSRVDLLQRVADRFNNANGFDVMGTASADIPGSSWRATYEFETQAAQPAFLPLSVRGPSMKVISMVGKWSEARVDANATDPEPHRTFGMYPFGQFNYLTLRLIDAQKIGTEIITVQGRAHSCEIIDAVYDASPQFKPHSRTAHKHFSIDPSEMLVLRETQSSPEGMEWTADVAKISFDLPPSEAMVQALKNFAAQAKDRPDWVGRSIPDLKLAQLSGSPMSLSEFRGKPVLLDFWGAYCGPCRRATVHAQDLARQYKSSGLTVLTLTQDTAQDAKLWTDFNQLSLPVLLDPDGAAFKAFDVQGIPVAILVDENGKVIHYWVGLDDLSAMDSILSSKLGVHPASNASSEPRQ
jgi:peroxiredoxin